MCQEEKKQTKILEEKWLNRKVYGKKKIEEIYLNIHREKKEKICRRC
jgi:hypothetical protein